MEQPKAGAYPSGSALEMSRPDDEHAEIVIRRAFSKRYGDEERAVDQVIERHGREKEFLVAEYPVEQAVPGATELAGEPIKAAQLTPLITQAAMMCSSLVDMLREADLISHEFIAENHAKMEEFARRTQMGEL